MELKNYGLVDGSKAEPFYRNFPAMDIAKAAPTTVGQGLYPLAQEVNKRVNSAIVYDEHIDDWSGPKTKRTPGVFRPSKEVLAGNCKSYVITKMLELHGQGVPRGAMRMATASVRNRDGSTTPHVVLLITQDDGRAWILDNNTDEIYDWPGLPTYEWDRAEVPGDPQRRYGLLQPRGLMDVLPADKREQVEEALGMSGVPGDGA